MEVVLFVYLIAFPLDTPLDEVFPDSWLPHLQQAAYRMDLARPDHETWLEGSCDMAWELRYLRNNYYKCLDCPPFSDADRFSVAIGAAKEVWDFQYKHIAWLEKQIEQQPQHRSGRIFQDLMEARRRKEVWYQLWCIEPRDNSPVPAVRQGLRELRQMLGDDDYYTGRMPAPVDIGSFYSVD